MLVDTLVFGVRSPDGIRALGGLVVFAAMACGAPEQRMDTVAASAPPPMTSAAAPALTPQAPAEETAFPLTDRPEFPIVQENACQGELCSSTQAAVACQAVTLVTSPTDSTPAGSLKPNDTLEVRVDLHVTKPGVVVLKDSHTVKVTDMTANKITEMTIPLVAGDTVLLLRYVAEGEWRAWLKGYHVQLREFWGGPGAAMPTPSKEARATGTWPDIDTWLRIERDGTEIGWWPGGRASPFTEIEYPCPAAPDPAHS